MMIIERVGGRRFPVVTAVVFTFTAAVNLLQFAVPSVLTGLQRTPAGLHGDWWRSGTSLFVQDGGVYGTASNLLFLLLVGTLAERVLPRPHWLLHYFGVGLAGEFVGYAWQPTGGGNSIAVCGLTGALALALWRGDPRLPGWAAHAVVIWCAAVACTLGARAFLPAVALCVFASVLIRVSAARGLGIERRVALVVPAVGVVLAAAQNIHGAALLLGGGLAVLLSVRAARPVAV
ncbi:rhomboid family intramembrane serine protease [Kitasatospora sp. HPMI-4]|uniref:rhomboid family intramembrane serine protease n=1 Tax=Kitasatospora sp. HPMI-4 TaxID=3448443 RepID=UPI003F1DD49D